MELETSRTTEASAAFIVGERMFRVVTDVVTVRSAKGRVFSAFVSPIALLVFEPHDRYVVSLTGEDLTVEELLIRVPTLKEEILAERGW